MSDVDIYYAVPNGYGIGRTFAHFIDAANHALSTIVDLQGLSRKSRAWVDVRAVTKTEFGESDSMVHRMEILAA